MDAINTGFKIRRFFVTANTMNIAVIEFLTCGYECAHSRILEDGAYPKNDS